MITARYIDEAINPDNTFFTEIIQSYISNTITSVATLETYLKYTTKDRTYLQIRSLYNSFTNVPYLIDEYQRNKTKTYEYIDISNTEIYNSYNSGSNNNLLVLYSAQNYLTYYYILIDKNLKQLNITVLNNNFDSPILSMTDLVGRLHINDITFVQVTKSGITKKNNLLNIISEININTNTFNYLDVSSSSIYNLYTQNNNNLPLLLINIVGVHDITLNLNNSSYLLLTSDFTLDLIYNFIQLKLNTNITTMLELKTYLKYTNKDKTFIRLIKLKPMINAEYIKGLLLKYYINTSITYEFLELNSDEINNFYKAYVKSFPAILLFKNILYTDDRFWQPCKILSGETTIFPNINPSINNSYINKSLFQLEIFLKYGLR